MGEIILNYDFLLFDRDDTINHDGVASPYVGIPSEIRKLLIKIPKNNKVIITNNGMSERIFIPAGIMQYFNKKLIFSGQEEADKIMKNPERYLHVLKKYAKKGETIFTKNKAIDHEHIGTFISKPSTYLFNKFLKYTNADPTKCIMTGDSIADIIPANKLGMTTVLIEGIEDKEVHDFYIKGNEEYLTPDFIVPVRRLSLLDKIFFK